MRSAYEAFGLEFALDFRTIMASGLYYKLRITQGGFSSFLARFIKRSVFPVPAGSVWSRGRRRFEFSGQADGTGFVGSQEVQCGAKEEGKVPRRMT